MMYAGRRSRGNATAALVRHAAAMVAFGPLDGSSSTVWRRVQAVNVNRPRC
jgi:hypothetical protein